MAKQDEYIRITTRIPPDVHNALVKLAKKTERSLNGELVARLQIAIALAEEELRPHMAEQVTVQYQVDDPLPDLIEIIKGLPIEKQRALMDLLK